jgi:hypothetical protein
MFQKGARKLIKTKITLQDKQQDELTFINGKGLHDKCFMEGVRKEEKDAAK